MKKIYVIINGSYTGVLGNIILGMERRRVYMIVPLSNILIRFGVKTEKHLKNGVFQWFLVCFRGSDPKLWAPMKPSHQDGSFGTLESQNGLTVIEILGSK